MPRRRGRRAEAEVEERAEGARRAGRMRWMQMFRREVGGEAEAKGPKEQLRSAPSGSGGGKQPRADSTAQHNGWGSS